jgi:hypothetical protein
VQSLATLLLLVVGLAVFVNLTRGTLDQWLRAKFVGAGA